MKIQSCRSKIHATQLHFALYVSPSQFPAESEDGVDVQAESAAEHGAAQGRLPEPDVPPALRPHHLLLQQVRLFLQPAAGPAHPHRSLPKGVLAAAATG